MQRETEAYREARRRVKAKAGFYKHLYVYIGINLTLIFLNLLKGHHVYHFFPAFAFWGIGLVFHYLRVFGIPGSGILSREWEDREMDKEMGRLNKHMPPKNEEVQEELTLKELQKNYRDSDLV